MRDLHCVAVVALLACAACGGSNSPTSPSSPGGARAPVTVRVMTFNIQHGIDGSERYTPQTAIAAIAAVNPDVVTLEELTRNHPSYNCDDQPAMFADGLTRRTGRQWSAIYREQWFTPDKSCMQSGRGDAAESEGIALLSAIPLGGPAVQALWDSGLGLAAPAANGVPIAVTHLTAQAANASDRVRQLATLLPWANSLGAARILTGDFNAAPESAEMQPVLATYHDAWTDAMRAGTARGRLDGITHKTVRIDYILFAPAANVQLLSAETIDTVPLVGREASDHRPVLATFAIR